MPTSHVKYSLFFSSKAICQAAKTAAKRSKSNWNEGNIEIALNMCREEKSICASGKACGMSEARLQNGFKMQEEEKTLVGSGRKISTGEQNRVQQILYLLALIFMHVIWFCAHVCACKIMCT